MKRVKNSKMYFYELEPAGHSIYLFINGVYNLVYQVKGFAKVVEFVRAKGGL